MRDLNELNEYRVKDHELAQLYGGIGDPYGGAFIVIVKTGMLRIIASNGEGWDHVSVSLTNRTPNWYEMEHIAKLFFKDNEVAVQYHMPVDMHVNIHPNCLHWWRPHVDIILLPPRIMV